MTLNTRSHPHENVKLFKLMRDWNYIAYYPFTFLKFGPYIKKWSRFFVKFRNAI